MPELRALLAPAMTVTYEQPADVRLNDSVREPRLHAFPEDSNVALCGRTRKQAGEDGRVVDGRRCTACVHAASRKGFVVR